MVYRKIPHYVFKNLNFLKVEDSEFLNKNFYIALPKLKKEYDREKILFSVADCFEIRVIKRSYSDKSEDMSSILEEGCFYFNEENEWILEVRFLMAFFDGSNSARYRLRLPLSAPFVEESEIGIYFDGTWLKFMANGEILNENSGLERFDIKNNEVFVEKDFEGIKVAVVEEVTLSYREETSNVSPSFFFPYGWNTYVGDVMNFYHDGTYHIMYLFDRRHHGSRNYCGAHYICHLTSENLIDWNEQKPIAEVTKPWITYGTGTMLYHNGKHYMTYGLHTERFENLSPKITPEFDNDTETYKNITFEEVFRKGGLPTGATFSYSDDGINFKPSNMLIQSARNPSGYKNDKGGITLYCGYGGVGIYESEGFDKPFKKSKESFDFLKNSIMQNSSECPAFFDWNGYKYLIVGFTGYYRTIVKNDTKLVDVAALGENIYEGLSVPMVSEFKDNRRLIAGWVRSPLGWGGVLMQRELVFEENGKLGMKWIPELAPKTDGTNLIKSSDELLKGKSIDKYKDCYLEVEIEPQNANRFGFSLSDEEEKACALEIDYKNSRVQINNAAIDDFGKKLPTMLEQIKSGVEDIRKENKDTPQNARNYALSNIREIDKPFTFKVCLRYSRRLRSTVIDAEIAGCRTLISVRGDFCPTRIKALCDGEQRILSAYLSILE